MQYSDSFESFWLDYRQLVTKSGHMGRKYPTWEAWSKTQKRWCTDQRKIDPRENDEPYTESDFARHVWRGLDAIKRHNAAAKKAGQFVPRMPYPKTWLNERGFDDEFETSISGKTALANYQCEYCGSDDLIGRSENQGWICRACHLEEWKKRNTIKPLLAKHPKRRDENWQQWSYRVLKSMPVGRMLLQRYGNAA